jgi:hypothetical protein
MADLAWRLYSNLRSSGGGRKISTAGTEPWPVLWVSGLGELCKGGLFEIYRDELSQRMASANKAELGSIWAFNHFSMNQFAIEVKKKARPGKRLIEELERIGRENAARVFGLQR